MLKDKKLNSLTLTCLIFIFMIGAYFAPAEAETGISRELSYGMMGRDVRQMQLDLSAKGYKLEPSTGVFGYKTHQSVLDFQKKNKMNTTGVFDMKTKEALKGNEKKARSRRAPEVSRSFSRDEITMLARVVSGEARGESFEGQVAVAAVIINRAESRQFPQSINGVIFQPGAFDAVKDGQIWLDPSEESIKAAELALSGYDPTNNAIYYWNPAKSTNKWIWSRPIIKRIGSHVFAR